MAGSVLVGRCNVTIDAAGDVQLQLIHDCGCCVTWTRLHPTRVEGLCEMLRFCAAQGAAQKAGAAIEGDGGRA